ncbi:caspase family protein [Treponema sp.]|uniref:caspase family protein n=1 Tax=Treponema sp. TaxID=166 RepID=UPI00257C7573|nr:caspase family protein [Treponema sp.]MBE6353629.1 caspase family protein [Treponema sp.]
MKRKEGFSVKKGFLIILAVFLFPVVSYSQNAAGGESGGVDRYAVFIGCNSAGKNYQKLLYAGTDAMAFQKTMAEIGGISRSNGILLLEPSRTDLDDAMNSIAKKISEKKNGSKRSEFLFYYSGHSDENSLLLGKDRYDYSELKAAINNIPSDVHVVILDSCYSGNFIRTKGGQKQKPFLVDDSSVVKGHAYLSSSSSQEFSQESDEIGSSFFTNSMLTGLRGAADSSGDKKVTLNELYSYAFTETLAKTEKTSAGPQHPNYNITLVGSGDLVLSDITNSDSVLHIAADLTGRFIIRDENGKLISEVNKLHDSPVYLALEEGSYDVMLIERNRTRQGSFTLANGKVFKLSADSFKTVAVEDNRVRGQEDDSNEDNKDNKEKELVYVPVDFSFVANELSRVFGKRLRSNMSFGFFNTNIYELEGIIFSGGTSFTELTRGLQFSTIFSSSKELHGVQASAIFNTTHSAEGIQAAGVFNHAHNVNGVQASSIFNSAHDVKGIQAAAVFNSAHDFTGVQASSIFNSARNLRGVQASGIFNAADSINGVQASAIANVAGEINGLQSTGIFNKADYVSERSLQLGLVNYAKSLDGIQIGLVNISDDGILETSFSYTSNNNLRAVLTSGAKRFHSVFGFSMSAKNIYRNNYSDGVTYDMIMGFGSRLELSNLNFDFEIHANEIFHSDRIKEEAEDGVTYYPSARFAAGFAPSSHFKIFTGLIISVEHEKYEDSFYDFNSNIHFKCREFTFHPEFEAGVSISFN